MLNFFLTLPQLLIRRSPTMIRTDIADSVQRLREIEPLRIHIPGAPELSEISIDSDLFIGKAYIIVAG